MPDIYELIWNNPVAHVTVSRRELHHDNEESGTWIDPNADVLLDEQGKASGCTSADAVRPLFFHVNEELFNQPTFKTFIDLLDNYTAQERKPERTLNDTNHAVEVDAFLDAVFSTEPMQMALEYVQREVIPNITLDQFRDRVRQMWFEPFTNNFSGSEPHCVGFEHVFVGEDESTPERPPNHCKDSVGGYHSWIKYYLDQKQGKVTYLGHDYESNLTQLGLADPNVATVLMTWEPNEAAGGAGHELLKKPGGFFVGTRPECEMALGSVALLEVEADRFAQGAGQEGHRRVKFGASFFDLVLHPHTIRKSPRQDGPHIRTFYPKFRGNQGANGGTGSGGAGSGGTGGSTGGGGPISLPTQPHNNSFLRIARALPNPVGPADQGEWVELQNVSSEESINLAGWHLADQEGRIQLLEGTMAEGQSHRFEITRAQPGAMQLRNAGGWILLFEGNQRRAAVRYGQAAQGAIVIFD